MNVIQTVNNTNPVNILTSFLRKNDVRIRHTDHTFLTKCGPYSYVRMTVDCRYSLTLE